MVLGTHSFSQLCMWLPCTVHVHVASYINYVKKHIYLKNCLSNFMYNRKDFNGWNWHFTWVYFPTNQSIHSFFYSRQGVEPIVCKFINVFIVIRLLLTVADTPFSMLNKEIVENTTVGNDRHGFFQVRVKFEQSSPRVFQVAKRMLNYNAGFGQFSVEPSFFQ